MRKRGVAKNLCLAIAMGACLSACDAPYVAAPEIVEAGKHLPEHVDYNWDVRPILSQNCFRCHGLEPSKRKAGLRLDGAEYAFDELPESPGKRAIVPGKPAKSELIRRITSPDLEERMPPLESHKVLSPVEIATLLKWVEQGAEYKRHWAYIAPRELKPKSTPFDAQAANPIDRYIYARLAKEQLKPTAPADKETLINRVTLDLTGLPPTLEEVDAFVADNSPTAYEKLVDRLLKSKTYSERMAQMWLDVARYADTGGYLNDSAARLIHPYRDWVIEAFAKNIPYDKFVTWQLAGDLLPKPSTEQLLATSFLRMGKRNNEGGIIDEEFRVEYVTERTELVGKAFMGLTVACARCHDHKYDVISQADYYSMTGYFNSIDERGIHTENAGQPMGPTLPWPTAKQVANLDQAHAKVAAQEAEYRSTFAAVAKEVASKANSLAGAPTELVTAVKASLDAGTEAYYPLDSIYVDSFDSLMIEPTRGAGGFGRRSGPPRDPEEGEVPVRLAADDLSRALTEAFKNGFKFENPIAIQKRQLMLGLKENELGWTRSGVPDGKPGAINNGKFIDGVKGKAVLLNDTIGFAAKDVGRYERTQEFSLDLWIKLREGKPYDPVSVIYNQGRAGDGGYELVLEQNRLKFNLSHVSPYNMLSVQTADVLPQGKWTHITTSYDGSSKAAGVTLYLDGVPAKTEVIRDRLTRSTMPRGGHSLYSSYYGLAFGKRFQVNEFKDGAIDEIRIFNKALNPLEVTFLHNPDAPVFKKGGDEKAVRQQLTDLLVAQDERIKTSKSTLRSAREAEMRTESVIPQLMIVRDAPRPRPTYILERGLYTQHGKEVATGMPDRVFTASGKLPPTRLGLTQWLFDKKNPLTSRVFVNRLWQSHFGIGIVETPEDFGTQSANPTHPELLDWLAIEFVRSGWDIRHMQKIIVMSSSYRQSSNVTPELVAKDPTNKLLARGPRYRLQAEMIRDGALFASGLLIDQIGGDSVFPYQPPRVWDGSSPGVNIYPHDVPTDEYHRRSMYTYVRRNAQAPAMMVFDMADRNVASVARKISNTPLQALVLLNDPQYVEAYRKMAERVILKTDDPQAQLVTLFRLGTRRKPMEQELEILTKYRDAEMARLTEEKSAATKEIDQLLSVGVTPTNPKVDKVRLAALTMVAATVMNSPDAYMLR